MESQYLETLNEPQRMAVTTTEGPMLVIAGAGSGKTRVLTMRIAYLIEHGVKPYNILALTFTNKAAREMTARIGQIVGEQTSRQIWMGTFHSVFSRILRIEAQSLGLNPEYTIYDTADSKSLLRNIIKNMNLDEKEYKLSNILGAISTAKNDLVSPEMYQNDVNYIERDKAARRPKTWAIYQAYANECRKSNALDFDDLLYYTHLLFRDHPDVLRKYQEKFKYVMVDEYQDTNHAQYVIIKKLVASHGNLCVVGDDAQSIYSFRGARIENILGLERDYPDIKIFKLEQNYRSTQNIVNAANSLIEKNQGRLKKVVFSENETGEPIRIASAHSDTEEAAMLCRDIVLRMRNEGLTPSDFAILYRTNAQSRAFEDQLRTLRLPYKIYGGLAFYQRKEIKDLLAYFRATVNHDDSESLKRIINYPARAIGATTVDKILQHANLHGLTMWQAMEPAQLAQAGVSNATANKIERFVALINTFEQQSERLNAYEFAAEVVSQSGIMKDLNENKNEAEGKDRYDNVNELLSGIKDFSEQKLESGDDNHIREYLQEVALVTDMDSDKSDDNKISLMTIHSSKGLEFTHVYIVGVEDEIFPGPQSAYNAKELEEERRLFYVALTRAKTGATISYCMQRFLYGKHQESHPSRFIADIDKDYIDRPESMNVDRPRTPFRMGQQSLSTFKYGTRTNVNSTFNHSTSAGSATPSRRFTPVPRQGSSFHSAPQSTTTHTANGEFTYSVGMKVIHETFGRGVIEAIEGTAPNTKLKVVFEHTGPKHLLVKFARLRPDNQ